MLSPLAASLEEALRSDGVPAVLPLADASPVARLRPEVLRRLCHQGVIEAVRTPTASGAGGRWRVTRASLASFLAGQTALGVREEVAP